MITYTHLADLSPKQFSELCRDNDRAGAQVLSVVALPDGSLQVLSPWNPAWTQWLLLNAAMGVPQREVH